MVTQYPQSDASSANPLSGDEATLTPIRILLVEDDIEIASIIRHLLESDGYEVLELYSGAEALELISAVERGTEAPFDVALLDIMMPIVNGYDVCQEIRRTERLGYIPIIMITALNSVQDVVRGLDLGADDYIVKPFDARELLARVRAALRIRGVDRAMRHRNWQLAALNALNDAIGGSLDGDEVLRAGLIEALRRLELDYAVAFLRDRNSGDITRVLYRDRDRWSEELVAQPVGPVRDASDETWQERDAYRLALDVMQSGQRRWETQAQGWPILSGVRRCWRAGVPLMRRSPAEIGGGRAGLSPAVPAAADSRDPSRQVLGALLVGAPADKPMIDLDLLTAIGNQIGEALEKCRFFQQAYDRSEELAALFDSISDLIYVVNERYEITALNVALRQWLAERRLRPSTEAETAPGPVVGQICYQILYERSSPCVGCLMAQALRTGEHIQWVERRHPSAEPREEWETSAYPIWGRKGGPSQAIILARDVTERRLLEASLSQAEKLAALGHLAAGLAHEINNPLTAIVANAQLLLKNSVPDDTNHESLTLIKQASDRAVKVVRNLLDFARREQYEFRPTDLNASLQAALELVRHQFHLAQVQIIEELAPDLPLAMVSGDHLQSVWLNLLLNARDAVTQQVKVDVEPRVEVSSCLQGDGLLKVTVRDNGVGIPPEQLHRLFEPFFTTKDPGKGTGLGLSTSYLIVKQHGGEMRVDSELGVGTIFSVLLPAIDQ